VNPPTAADEAATDELQVLAARNREAMQLIEELPDLERAIMLMRGTFCGRSHTLVEVASTFGVTRTYVQMVEGEVFRILGPEWLSEWRAAREATRDIRRTSADRRDDHDRRRRQPGRQMVVIDRYWDSEQSRYRLDRIGGSDLSSSMPRPRERRGGCRTRRRGSRRGAATRTGARGDPDDLGDEPPSHRRLLIGGWR
jgi:hypothetical protein